MRNTPTFDKKKGSTQSAPERSARNQGSGMTVTATSLACPWLELSPSHAPFLPVLRVALRLSNPIQSESQSLIDRRTSLSDSSVVAKHQSLQRDIDGSLRADKRVEAMSNRGTGILQQDLQLRRIVIATYVCKNGKESTIQSNKPGFQTHCSPGPTTNRTP